MASEANLIDTDVDSDNESFDSILEPPQTSDTEQGTITIHSPSQDSPPDTVVPLEAEPEVPLPPRTRSSSESLPSPVRTPKQRSSSHLNVMTIESSTGTPVASTSKPLPEASPSPPSPETTTTTTTKGKLRRPKSIVKTSSENTEDNTPLHGSVLEFGSKEEITRRVAFPAKMIGLSAITYKDTWGYHKIFGYDDFFASGLVYIQPHGFKSPKSTMDNAYVFLVMEGTIEATVHRTNYTLCQGGLLQVPRGNVYSIKNISATRAKLFFVQARKVPSHEESNASLLTAHNFRKPDSDFSMILHWLVPRLVDQFLKLRTSGLVFYQRHLKAYYERLTGGRRRLYLLFFVLGLMIRRLPFIGSPPILNIQLIRYS